MKRYAVDLSHESAMYVSDEFSSYREAVEYLDEVVDNWEEELKTTADRSWASSSNMYAAMCGNRSAQVNRVDED